MTKRIALFSLALAALLAACTTPPLQRGGDGMYVSTPAHPAAAPSAQSSSADRGE
jgi:hypothetical protein